MDPHFTWSATSAVALPARLRAPNSSVVCQDSRTPVTPVCLAIVQPTMFLFVAQMGILIPRPVWPSVICLRGITSMEPAMLGMPARQLLRIVVLPELSVWIIEKCAWPACSGHVCNMCVVS